MSANLLQNVKVTRVLNGVAAGTTNQNGTAVDMANYEGVIFIAAFGALTSTAVTGLKVQQGLLSDGSDGADLTGTAQAIADDADNKLLAIDVYQPRERYVRPVVTRGTANAVIDGVIAIQYGPRKKPTSHDSTVAGSETHVSPAEGTA